MPDRTSRNVMGHFQPERPRERFAGNIKVAVGMLGYLYHPHLLRVSPLRGVWPTSRIIVAPGDWQLSRFPGTTAPLGNTSWTFPYQMMLVLFLGKGNWSSPRVTNVTIMPTMSASPAIHSSSVCLLLFLLVRFPILHLPLGRSGTPLGACCCCMDWLEK